MGQISIHRNPLYGNLCKPQKEYDNNYVEHYKIITQETKTGDQILCLEPQIS